MIHAYGGSVNGSARRNRRFGMRNTQRLAKLAEVMDKVVFTSWKSMKACGLPDLGKVPLVFPTETYVPRWKLLARPGVEAYDGRNVSPRVEE
jgi:hypothetical protein